MADHVDIRAWVQTTFPGVDLFTQLFAARTIATYEEKNPSLLERLANHPTDPMAPIYQKWIEENDG